MPDELIVASTTKLLKGIHFRIQQLQKELDAAVFEASKALRPPRGDTEEPDYLATLQQVDAKLHVLKSHLEALADAVNALNAIPIEAEEGNVGAVDVTPTSSGRTGEGPTVVLSGMSPTTLHRMSEIATSLRIGNEQVVERSVATQSFVDSKLRERWRFFMKRGRERRAVNFPGQVAT
jgi:hypothetical protein